MVSGSVVALVTPMHPSGSIDWESLQRLIDWHVAEGTAGIVSVGTTGESSTIGVTSTSRSYDVPFWAWQAGFR